MNYRQSPHRVLLCSVISLLQVQGVRKSLMIVSDSFGVIGAMPSLATIIFSLDTKAQEAIYADADRERRRFTGDCLQVNFHASRWVPSFRQMSSNRPYYMRTV